VEGSPGPLALVELAHLSDTGRVRRHNEDRSLADLPVLAVADGMGGAKAGEVAAEMAVSEVGGLAPPVTADAVRDALERANAAIRRLAEEDPDKAGMGTTLTAAVLADGRLDVVHVGDSRAYLWRDGELRQLTQDHSVVAELVRRGSISPEDAETHPHRNVITRALGAEPQVVPDTVSEPLREGDVVLLCSDGLSSYVGADEIARVLSRARTLAEAARLLVERANAAGGVDNVTVVLARAGRPADRAAAAEGTDDAPTGRTAEMRVLGGVRGHAGTDRPSAGPPRTARVLQPVPRRRRSRLKLGLAGAAVLLVAVGGVLAWVGSRSYSLEATPEGGVRVMHGLPYAIGGLELSRPWQELGVPADAVRAEDGAALDDALRGQGEAVELAARLVWRHGLPEVPDVAPPPLPRPAPAAPEPAPAG
jgi:PPM family protein phosphatase